MAIRFAKVDGNLDGHPKIRRAGRNGREVFLFVLRRNCLLDRTGRVPMTYLQPWYLADQLMMSEADAADGLARALDAGLLAVDDGCVAIIGWDDDWSKAPLDDAERKAKQRAARAGNTTPVSVAPEHSRHPSESNAIPMTSVDESRNVTIDKRDIRDCPDSHTLEERRREEIREREVAPLPPLSLVPDQPKAKRKAAALPDGWTPAASEVNLIATAEATSRQVDPEQELAKMRDWAQAKGEACKDWDARWRNWLRSARASPGSGGTWNQNNNTGIRKTKFI